MLAVVAAAVGEPRRFQASAVTGPVWFALVYLIGMGSIVGFTSYLWLIHRESPTKVGTYAYVNPVVAVVIGYFFGHEAVGVRTVMGTALVLASVVLITLGKSGVARVGAGKLVGARECEPHPSRGETAR